ncbi:apicomplexan conserved [Cryptosporidium sp. chipmunk genotype I]|uniref:apicomplexan conserved n=1 Tax=Cryptosporidium sp. chipmunk genotype I TaxID=1280935 RepID=UPI00351A1E36|nr:apicomplexan conserved [Cryptosporidium sp. chipmunk genotype I]
MNVSNLINADVDEKGFVSDKLRDDFFQIMKNKPENRTCFDCESRNPTWLSLSFAVFICLNCSSDHRKMGVHISFVRSSDLDKFTPIQLVRMDIGGNGRARNYFKQALGVHFSPKTKEYANSIFGRQYKQMLDTEISEYDSSSLKKPNEFELIDRDSYAANSEKVDNQSIGDTQSIKFKSMPSNVGRYNSIQKQNSLINQKGRRLDENFDFDSRKSDEIAEYFDEGDPKIEKQLILTADGSGSCFFGRFSVPTHAQSMAGAIFVDYLSPVRDIDSLNVKYEPSIAPSSRIDPNQINIRIRDSNSRHCIGRQVSKNNSNYAAIIDKGSHYEFKILDGLFVFDPSIKGKNESNSDVAENLKRDYIFREAAVTARIQESSNKMRIKLENDIEDDQTPESNVNKGIFNKSCENNAMPGAMKGILDDIYDKDFGLKQQEKKRKISAMLNKENSDDSRVVVSALSLTMLKSGDDWDYDGDGKMSDDEGYIEKNEVDEKFEEEHNPNLIIGNIDYSNSEDDEGPDGILTEYGKTLKTMIANQQDMEADEELNLYSDEIDDEVESKSNISSSAPAAVNTSIQFDLQKKTVKSPTAISSSINGLSRSLEAEVIRKLSLAGGRMQIKPFLDAMKVKKKNKYFEEIQEIIKKVADTHTEYHSNTKISYITLKSNYRQR